MDAIIEYAYSDVIVAAPYVIGAYVLIWIALLVFVIMMLNRSKKTQKDIDALKDAIEGRQKNSSKE